MHKFDTLSVFSGITGSLFGTASLAQSASFIEGNIEFPDGLEVTGSLVVTGGITGSISGSVSNAISSSYAVTASYALNGGDGGVSSSYALSSSFATTASYADSVAGFVSFPEGLDITGSLNVSGSITGSLLGTASNAVSSSFASTASYATTAQNVLGSITSASYAATASLLLGSIESASYALTSSYAQTAQTLLGSVESASYAATASVYLGSVESASFATSASYAPTILPAGVVSSSVQINTGSFTGSFTGTLTGTGSWATNAISASYIEGIAEFPDGLDVTGSLNVSGSITGSLLGTASFATTASYALNAVGGVSSSYATTASFAETSSYAQSISGFVRFPDGLTVTGSLNVSGSITGSLLGTASVATELVKQFITISSSISPAFTTITSGAQHLTNGVYSISSVLNSTSIIDYTIAGTFAWHTGSVSTSDTDEIFLHRTGQSASSASIFMRTNAVSGSTTFLQIGSDLTLTTGSYTFTLVRII